jgi:DNA-binding transcriptional MocR family regulator
MNIILDRDSKVPLYKQVVRQIRGMILEGTLPAGFGLPPERRLSQALGVTRTTIISAYDELKAEGLANAHVGRGTIVCAPQHPPLVHESTRTMAWNRLFRDETLRPPDPLLRDLLDLTTRQDIISFAVGIPSRDYLPTEEFAATVNTLLEESSPALLGHSPTEGHPPLRESLSSWLAGRGIRSSQEDIVILSGSQQGLHLVARLFLHPGDSVIVEEPTYFGAIEAFRRTGARLIPVPLDEEGMRIDMLEAILERHRPKLIYTIPTFQNPSGREMSLERRHRLLALASGRGIPILEEDPYSELRYRGTPLPSIKSMDTAGIVLYLSTASKFLFPGLRLGWLVAPRPVVAQCTLIKQSEDLHTNTLGQYALDRLIRSGMLDAHIKKVVKRYRDHCQAMERALTDNPVDGMHWQAPRGGFYFWCRLPEGINMTKLLARATEEGIAFLPGHPCFVEEPGQQYIRLSFSSSPPDAIEAGIRRLTDALRASVEHRTPRERPALSHPIV